MKHLQLKSVFTCFFMNDIHLLNYISFADDVELLQIIRSLKILFQTSRMNASSDYVLLKEVEV